MSKEEIKLQIYRDIKEGVGGDYGFFSVGFDFGYNQADQQTKELQEKVECRDKVILEYINLRYEDTIIIKHLQSKIDELENEIESMHQNNAGADI